MTDLHERLGAIAERVPVEDRLDDIVSGRAVVRLETRDRRPRTAVWAVAAAVVALVGGALVVWAVTGREAAPADIEVDPPQFRSLPPEVFPTLADDDPRRAGLTAMYGASISFGAPKLTLAVVGRSNGDGSVDTLSITAQMSAPESPGTDVVIDGETFQRYAIRGGVALAQRIGDVYVGLTGDDPEALVAAAGGMPVTDLQVRPGASPTFALAPLPPGYEVVVMPTINDLDWEIASIDLPGSSGAEPTSITTSRYSELFASGSLVTKVDIEGDTGWLFSTSAMVVWQVAPETWARVIAPTPEEAIELARAAVFVDEATWLAEFDLERPPGVAPAPTTP